MSSIDRFRNASNSSGNTDIRLAKSDKHEDGFAIIAAKGGVLGKIYRFLSDPTGKANQAARKEFVSAFTKSYPHLADEVTKRIDINSARPLKGSTLRDLFFKADTTPATKQMTYAGADMGMVTFGKPEDVEKAFHKLVDKGEFKGGKVGIFEFANDFGNYAAAKTNVKDKVDQLTERYDKQSPPPKSPPKKKGGVSSDDGLEGGKRRQDIEADRKGFIKKQTDELTRMAVWSVAADLGAQTDLRQMTDMFSEGALLGTDGKSIKASAENLFNFVPIGAIKKHRELGDKVEKLANFKSLAEFGRELQGAIARQDLAAIRVVGSKLIQLAGELQDGIQAMQTLLSKKDFQSDLMYAWQENAPQYTKTEREETYRKLSRAVDRMNTYIVKPDSFLNSVLALGFVAQQKPQMVVDRIREPDVIPLNVLTEQDLEEGTNGVGEPLGLAEHKLTEEDLEVGSEIRTLTERSLNEPRNVERREGEMPQINPRDRLLGDAINYDTEDLKLN